MRETTSNSDTVYYFAADHLGSTSVTMDASGTKIGEMKYYPFGETRYVNGTLGTDRRFTGQREETGLGSLYDYGARFYSPVLGRFLSADSIVPGAASGSGGGAGTLGYDSSSRLTTLTTDFHEFIGKVTQENQAVLQYGPFFQWSEKVRQDNPVPSGPLNPQALNRYSYVLNNPLRYVDPTGHDTVIVSKDDLLKMKKFLEGVQQGFSDISISLNDFAAKMAVVTPGAAYINGEIGVVVGTLSGAAWAESSKYAVISADLGKMLKVVDQAYQVALLNPEKTALLYVGRSVFLDSNMTVSCIDSAEIGDFMNSNLAAKLMRALINAAQNGDLAK
jgi:RHS repeat-associated protein